MAERVESPGSRVEGRSSVAEEVSALAGVMSAIETLDPAAQARVLNHAMGRLNELHPERLRWRT